MSPRNYQQDPVEGKLAVDRCGSGRDAEIGRDRAWICVPELRQGRGAFRLFVEGDELYTAMVTAIERAERRIRMESFIFAADEVGRRFAAALADKARRGWMCGCTSTASALGSGRFATCSGARRRRRAVAMVPRFWTASPAGIPSA